MFGVGFVSEMCREIVETLEKVSKTAHIDLIVCIPRPSIPDFGMYIKIGLLFLFAWFLLFIEPYGLRARQMVMNYYYPQRSAERTVWLYQLISRQRLSFVKFARRKMRKKFLKDSSRKKFNDEVTCFELFRAKINK